MKRSVLKVLPSATVHVTLAEAAEKLRALCSSGVFKFVGALLRKQIESVTQWVEMLVSARAPTLPDQVKESFTGRKGLTKLYSTVPLHDMKKIDVASP